MRRLKGRLGVENGLPPATAAQFDRYDDLRARAGARYAFGGYEEGRPLSMASLFLRGDIAVLEDVATLTRARGRRARKSCGAGRHRGRPPALRPGRLPLRHTWVARRFYEPIGFERIGGAWSSRSLA